MANLCGRALLRRQIEVVDVLIGTTKCNVGSKATKAEQYPYGDPQQPGVPRTREPFAYKQLARRENRARDYRQPDEAYDASFEA